MNNSNFLDSPFKRVIEVVDKSVSTDDVGNDIKVVDQNNFTRIVFSGGGVKGLSFIGALRALHKKNMLKNLNTFVGTSAGALLACMCVLSYTPKEMKNKVLSIDFPTLVDFHLENFLELCGFDNGKGIETSIKEIIKEKTGNENITFQELYNKTQKRLVITAVTLFECTINYFSHTTHANMPVYLAIRMSMSIPYFFAPVQYEGKFYIDGGCIDNYPIAFEKHNDKTIGLSISTNHKISPSLNMENLTLSIFNCLLFKSKKIQLNNNCKSIVINIDQYNSVDFNLDDKAKKNIIKYGYDIVAKELLNY